MRAFLTVAACVAIVAAGSPWDSDLKRARQWTPREEYRGYGTLASANARLNKHLAAKKGIQLKACEDFTAQGLRGVLRDLLPRTSVELKSIYSKVDGRGAKYTTIAHMEAHWSKAPVDDHRVRDAHCHEAVMWFVHHLTTEEQVHVMKSTVLPMLPVADHRIVKGSRAESDHAGKFYDEKVTCQNCHIGGIDSLGVSEVAPKSQKEKSRRCYTNYKAIFGIDCEPCDGIAGKYSGDDLKYFTPTECQVVNKPEEVPEAERVKPTLPEQFSVDVVGGSDRFGRTTNPLGKGGLPGPVAKLYGQIYGKWFMDVRADSDLWMLRHDTTYASVTENGVPIPFIKPSVSEIHAQTSKQRSQNCTGPMVSMIYGMPSWMPGGCTCMPDPVGVPDTQSIAPAVGLANMQYMGRIKLPELEYLHVPIELDHWANWFFHIFMDTNASAPHYGRAPSRISDSFVGVPKTGVSVYGRWTFKDPAIEDPDIWHRGLPADSEETEEGCVNADGSPACDHISQTTFPPKGQGDSMSLV